MNTTIISQTSTKITASHLERKAVIYIRQSSPKQVRENLDSQLNQRALVDRAKTIGWHPERIDVLDGDLGQSAGHAGSRDAFKSLTAELALGHIGIVFGWDVSRLARNNADWYHLLDLAALFGTLIGDNEGIYDPRIYNDRLLLGLKGTMSEAELHMIRQRLDAGRLSKVKRGEYVQRLPTGLVRLADNSVIKDPDAQVCHVIDLVLAKFNELGTCQKVLHYCKQHQILIPRQQHSGSENREIEWKQPSHPAILQILKNPAYAGVFAYGRRAKDPTRQQPGRPTTGLVRQPIENWQCLIQDAYPAYISWEQYQVNQIQLRDNANRFRASFGGSRGAPRKGAALLQGLIVCGRCGRRMHISYKPKVRYVCNALATDFAESTCAYLDGASIEEFVVNSFFEAIQPAQLNALDKVLAQQKQEHNRLETYHHQQIKRAEYEVSLARRRYEQVDPENRLVAASLEQQWEAKLRNLKESQEAAKRFKQQPLEVGVSEHLRHQLSELNQHLPHLWRSEEITNEHRKQLLRSLISQVILQRLKPDQIHVKIVWVSGHFSEGIVRPPIHRQADVTGYQDMVERTKQLWQAGKTDEEIAKTLTTEGFRSARNLHVSSGTVFKIRHRHQFISTYHECRMAEKVDGLWTVRGLCQHLGINRNWLYRYIRNGKLPDTYVIRRPPHNNYLICDDPELLETLKKAAPCTRQLK
ncbi:site-specific recombinase, DNA invertase Pin [Leptolyngbya sp. PCC 7375]|nr:site-specific recombinase, DNA invertase Pin [Leptolyngbya sp. PCC 7375]